MATITNAKLTITHDHTKRTARPIVKCDVNFTPLELCQMKNCAGIRHFKLKCQLWAFDDGLFDGDDFLYTYSDVFYLPDTSPTAKESRTFDVTVGEGLLDEDWFGRDEIYGLLKLVNLTTHNEVKKKTNTVKHHFEMHD